MQTVDDEGAVFGFRVPDPPIMTTKTLCFTVNDLYRATIGVTEYLPLLFQISDNS